MFPWYLIFLKRSLAFPFCCFPLFLCIDRWGRLPYLFLLFFGILHSDTYIFPFLLCFTLLFFSQLFVRPLWTACVNHNKLWKILKEMGIPDHLIWLLRNLYAGQEATVRTGHGTTDWFQIGKAVHQGCILSPCLFNFYSEYIMRNAGLEEGQAGIKFARRNINNLIYADDTTLIAERRGT